MFRVLPGVGKTKALQFRMPTPASEKLFMASFNTTLDRYRELLAAQKAGRLNAPQSEF